ncbi:restriction endonuclease subunit S [Magnetovirga frankeli]|uniref:restriction endonuclease subunit S n=1 Tax=Magnetovirga frankeli TaxID=947516 RepID=UPI001293C030|nr:restriction endonuclease subunit S [gamma proteobacterium SS-5]
MINSPTFAPSRLRVSNLLEQHFDTAFAAPDGIAKLRELILTLAMQGKLVEQDPNDPPASELLKEIEKEKVSREGAKARRGKEKTLPPVKAEEVPYQLPQGWEWVKIRDICHDWGQKTPDAMITYIDVGAIDNKLGTISSNTQLLDASEAPSRARKIVKPGTVIYSTVRPYLLNIAIVEKEYDPEPIASTAFAILHPFALLSARYIYHYLRSPAFIRYVESAQKGVAYPAINDGDFFSGLFPLSPLPEQHRIVARIDQLMARCDALETLRKEREEKRLAVHAAAIKQLLDPTLRAFAPSREENSSFEFLAQHFGELYTVKENVAELRKAILQLAVMGRLVPQNPNDPPASELLKEIEAEKQRASREGAKTRRGKEKKLPPIKPEEVPYELPQGWEWVRLGELFRVTSGKNLPKDKMQDGNIPVFGGNGITGFHNKSNVEKPTVVIGRVGYYCGSIHLTPAKAWITDNAFLTIYDEERLFQGFVIWLLKTINLQVDTSATAQPVISGSKIYPILIPLPPLPEQHRIVARIDQLMALCDTLDQQIEAATGKQSELLDAVMAAV